MSVIFRSLQKHAKRAEHWIVVTGTGTATVTSDEKVSPIHANQSTYIPLGSKHRLENPGTEPLHLIEVRSGSYLGEDDIVRFEDSYGREGDEGSAPPFPPPAQQGCPGKVRTWRCSQSSNRFVWPARNICTRSRGAA